MSMSTYRSAASLQHDQWQNHFICSDLIGVAYAIVKMHRFGFRKSLAHAGLLKKAGDGLPD